MTTAAPVAAAGAVIASEVLTWHAAAELPDADLDVLLWVLERDGASDWTRGWFDGEHWRGAEHGGVLDGRVTHWAEPAGPAQSAPDDVADESHQLTDGPLLPCPLCGAAGGYRLHEGTTYRWWEVHCVVCDRMVDECRSDRRADKGRALPRRWPAADVAWQQAGAHADRLRRDIARLTSICVSLHDGLLRGDDDRELLALAARAWAAPNAQPEADSDRA